MTAASKRRYHSPLRADQAEQTRRRILEAAYGLFVADGYARTTIAAVAAAASVSPETIYLAFEGKRGLLEAVIESAIAGEDDPPPEDAWSGPAEAHERLARMVDYSCGILARTRPVHAVIRGAADKEPFAAALSTRLLQDRLTSQTERIRRHLGQSLRPGLPVAEAGQRYCALASPELYQLFTVELGWSAGKHRRWLTDLLATELLGQSSGSPS
jgi:AcrR family transcriptional regulator